MKTITEMAREAGAAVGNPVVGGPEIIFPQCLDVQRFAELVRADEREACAEVCETAEVPIDIDVWQGTKKALSAATALGLAAAIRARGE
jgi:hypothetical protein